MLNLNLLPPQEKTAMAYRTRTRAVKMIGSAIFGMLFVGVALLLPTIIFLGFEKSTSLESLRLESEDEARAGITTNLADIRLANKQANFILQHASSTPPLAEELGSLTLLMPSGIRIHSILYRAKTRQFIISGTSPTREIFLAFENALEHDPRIAKVISPVSNVIHETDVKFLVTANIK